MLGRHFDIVHKKQLLYLFLLIYCKSSVDINMEEQIFS